MTKLARGVAAAVLALLIAAGAAWADATIYAGPPNQFFQGDVTIAQGEAITFTNLDTMTHDVTASGKGADGKPLFASAQVGTGASAPVEGVQYLTAGSYPYICSIHPFMTGTITVSSDGAPKPRPGGGPSSSPAPASAADTTAPSLEVKIIDTKKNKVRKRRSLQMSVTTDEPASLTITARSGRTVVAKGKAKLIQAGARKLSVKLTKAGLKLAKGRKPVPVSVSVAANDAAGNASTASASGRLR